MTPYRHLLWACVLLAACEGNPFLEETDTDTGTTSDGGINSDGAPVTTTSPSPSGTIVRREATSTDSTETGNGYVEDVTYDSGTDTFTVTGLAFDGGNVYQRGTSVSSLGQLGQFAVYEADSTYADDVTGTAISQFSHRALYGRSTSGNTEFAVVRTGAYASYGYGGFLYQRNSAGAVTLKTSGQANYAGQYGGLRDFDGAGGLEYVDGDMTIAIDFDAFADGEAVDGRVRNRSIYDVNGNDITSDVVTALNTEYSTSLTTLPVMTFTIDPDALDANGEMSSGVTSTVGGEAFEEGNYYAVLSGDMTAGGNDEIVGIIVVTADDPRADGVTVRETGGFLLYRN